MLKVLFVCTGNICRSPTAQGLFEHYAAELGLGDRIEADSAGLHGFHEGEPPDSRARRVAAERGVEIGHQRARRVGRADFSDFDLIIGMDLGHFESLTRMAPEGGGDRIRLLLDFVDNASEREVPDPYYGGEGSFLHAIDLIDAGTRALAEKIRDGKL